MIADLLLAAAAFPPLAAGLWLLLLTLLSRRALPPAPPRPAKLRFEVLVPAHDEEAGIAGTVESLLALDYPKDLFRVRVIADNCSDATAEQARAAGADVLARNDPGRRGKGYALELGFAESLRGRADATVVVDADTQVSPNLLSAFAARLAAGALAVQADYGVQNPSASWRTRLMHLALSMFHVLRSLGRERLGVSCGLRGNGMCFSRAALEQVPYRAFSIVEDLEYGVALGRAGHRVVYAAEAHVLGEMVSSGRAARSQRERWEGGRRQFARTQGAALLLEAMRQRSLLLFDLGMDVLVPPLAQLVLVLVSGAALSLWARAMAPLALWLSGLFCVAAYVARGLWLSNLGARALLDLAWAPLYIVWKLSFLRRGAPSREWVRTAREGKRP